MATLEIVRKRLHNQLIVRGRFETPGEVVRWLGAVQAQDYRGALWAVGLRLPKATEATVENAIAEKTIVRTWPMRGTLHFAAPEDVRWLLRLLTPRIIARNAGRYRQLELDGAVFSRSRNALERALQGGRKLSRTAVYKALEAAGIATAGQRGIHILGWLAQEGVICFGSREGKQQTFALLDEWVPAARALERDEALSELARRYFTSHGPATLQDYAWWSGLTLADAKAGLEMSSPHLVQEAVDGRTYWFSASMPEAEPVSSTAHLLPVYDEYTVAYKDRSAVLDPAHVQPTGNGIFRPIVIVAGRVVGTWGRTSTKNSATVARRLFTSPSRAEERALAAAAERYTAFVSGSGS